MKRLLGYLNPIARLGKKQYSILFPLSVMVFLCVLSEVFAYLVVKDPMVVGVYAIFLFVAFIIYFAFHDGVRGGFVSSGVTILYYVYIMYTRQYSGRELAAGVQTTLVLALLYILLAWIIGWLKQTIDTLIEKEADEKKRLQAIVQQLPVGIVITDNSGRIELTNRQLDKILGMKMPKGTIAGKDMLIPTQQQNKQITPSQAPLAQALATGRAVTDKEFSLLLPGGKQVYVNVNASVIHNTRGKVIAAASIVNDITQQKEMEKRKDDFVNMASHELKTPITSMKLYIDSLISRVKKYDDEKANSVLGHIKNQTERLQELVNDLLDVSRLQTGRLSFNRESFRIDDLIEETVEGLQGSAKQKILFSKQKAFIVYADKFRIYQVLTNLLTNAMKYSPAEKEIIIRLKKIKGKVIVSVQDFGIGIAKEQQKKIFDRLYQVTDDTEKTFPGLGMGLYISKEIIKRHKGLIWVESTKGRGSTFYFSIPAHTNGAA